MHAGRRPAAPARDRRTRSPGNRSTGGANRRDARSASPVTASCPRTPWASSRCSPSQGDVLAVFVPLSRLQRDLAQPARVNTVLVGSSRGRRRRGRALRAALARAFTLQDARRHDPPAAGSGGAGRRERPDSARRVACPRGLRCRARGRARGVRRVQLPRERHPRKRPRDSVLGDHGGRPWRGRAHRRRARRRRSGGRRRSRPTSPSGSTNGRGGIFGPRRAIRIDVDYYRWQERRAADDRDGAIPPRGRRRDRRRCRRVAGAGRSRHLGGAGHPRVGPAVSRGSRPHPPGGRGLLAPLRGHAQGVRHARPRAATLAQPFRAVCRRCASRCRAGAGAPAARRLEDPRPCRSVRRGAEAQAQPGGRRLLDHAGAGARPRRIRRLNGLRRVLRLFQLLPDRGRRAAGRRCSSGWASNSACGRSARCRPWGFLPPTIRRLFLLEGAVARRRRQPARHARRHRLRRRARRRTPHVVDRRRRHRTRCSCTVRPRPGGGRGGRCGRGARSRVLWALRGLRHASARRDAGGRLRVGRAPPAASARARRGAARSAFAAAPGSARRRGRRLGAATSGRSSAPACCCWSRCSA